MKKISLVILSLVIFISLAACSENIADKQADISVETYTAPENNKMDLDISAEAPKIEVETIKPIESAKIELDISEIKINMVDNVEIADAAKIDGLTEAKVQEIAATKAELLKKLETAFSGSGIKVDINETSGEVSLDSSVLFGSDSAELSAEGKDFLNKFFSLYAKAVFSDEFDGFISKIKVEGHTAPLANSTYESGLPLSQKRAETVKNYCLSSETGISETHISKSSSMLEAVGLSNSKPVKDSSGNVDLDASRRVSFRFIINLD